MSEPTSDADKIRNKRLAKLGGGQTPASTESRGNDTKAEAPSEPLAEQEELTSSLAKVRATPPPNPFSQLALKAGNNQMPRINITNIGPGEKQAGKRARTPSTSSSSTPIPQESIAAWENKTLSTIFRVSINPDVTEDAHGHTLRYLVDLAQEMAEQEATMLLRVDHLDQVILEAASHLGKVTPLTYLLGCWKRITRQMKTGKHRFDDPRLSIMKEARRLCMSFCIFAVAMPDMFGLEPPESNPLTPHLLYDPEEDTGICHDFLTEIVSRFPEDEMAQEVMVGAVEGLSLQLSKMSMIDNYKLHVLALRNLVRFPPIIKAFVKSPLFLPPDVEAPAIEKATLLGPFFAISPLQGDVTVSYFSGPRTRDKSYIANSQNALRLTLQAHQRDLLEIVNQIVRASTESKELLLDWFAICVNLNHKRRALRVDPETVSSDAFMVNMTVCLDQLCEPFMDATFSKIDRIDANYLRRDPRVDIREETKLNADQQASDDFYSQQAAGTTNFISSVFFLNLAAHHYGTEAANSTLNQLEKDLSRMEQHLKDLEADRPQFSHNANQLSLFETTLKRYQHQLDRGLSYKYSVQGVLLDELMQSRAMQFMRYATVWLLRVASPANNFPSSPLLLPLATEQPDIFKYLPEYFLEDVVGIFKFIMRNMPHIITTSQSEELVMLCITFLNSSEYVKNPYLKAGLVTIMYRGIWPVYSKAKGVLGDLLNSLPFATDHLLHALMKFYIEVEQTGAHTQFYDKFNIRYEIFQIIKCVWSNQIYREHLSQEARVNVDFFVRFVNLLLNDVTYVLDESLTSLHKIHEIQVELTTASAMDAAMKTEKEEALEEAKSKAKSYMGLTNETVAMLKRFTEALADSFTMPEIVQRLADMLDYNLDAMVGPKSSTLRVENAQQYGFNPKVLLAELVDVYLNLRSKESFVFAVARDGRSYKPANFENATNILKKWALKSPDDLMAWVALGEQFQKAKEIDDQADEDLGDVPDEFLDPIMATIMNDPVILPASRATLDRSTVRSHLLSDPSDPFNRAPLKIEDVVPNVELKAKIDAFKTEKKGKKLAEAGMMAMDTTPG